MSTVDDLKKNDVSAFEQGNLAGKDIGGPVIENPFPAGSPQHNNFEVGRRFGASHAKPSQAELVVDEDEEGN